MMEIPAEVDCLVIGGGPAGSVTASLLGREKRNVAVFEKAKHPRYHIGESLLASVIYVLDIIGAREKIDKHGFTIKPGSIFYAGEKESGYVDFSLEWLFPYSYNVRRSEFDKILLDHAKERGAKVYEETEVTSIEWVDERPVSCSYKTGGGKTGQIRFKYLVDASGLTGLISNQYLKNRIPNPLLKNVAVGAYFRGPNVTTTFYKGRELKGAQTIEALADGSGWMWSIPNNEHYGGGSTSFGVVMKKTLYDELREKMSLEEIFKRAVDLCPHIKEILKDAECVSEYRMWLDFSYRAEKFCGKGYFLVGDAGGFIDPFFSTGVHISTMSGVAAAACVNTLLDPMSKITEMNMSKFYHDYFELMYTRLIMMVGALYIQMGNPKEELLAGMLNMPCGRAFDVITPVITGRLDTRSARLSPEQQAALLNMITELSNKMHFGTSSDKVPETITTNVVAWNTKRKIFSRGLENQMEHIGGRIIEADEQVCRVRELTNFEHFSVSTAKKVASMNFIFASWYSTHGNALGLAGLAGAALGGLYYLKYHKGLL